MRTSAIQRTAVVHVIASLGLCLVPVPAEARPGVLDPPPVLRPVEGIKAVYSTGRRASYYFPEFNEWPRPDVMVYPVLAAGRSGTRALILRMILLDPPGNLRKTLKLEVDGENQDLPLDGEGAYATNIKGCRAETTITIGGRDDLVRRMVRARDVRISFGKGRSFSTYRLNGADRANFGRIVSLSEAKTLPPARPDDEEYRDGEVLGPDAGDIENPELVPATRIKPKYPREAVRRNVMGRVTLAATIDTSGAVTDLKVLRAAGGDCGLEESAIAAVGQWRYKPARKDGRPIEVPFTVVIDYMLQRRR